MRRRALPSLDLTFPVAVALCLHLVCAAPTLADDVFAYIGGGWNYWAGGDTLQFGGDCNTGTVCSLVCPDWDCMTDTCYSFRKVTAVDLEDCSFTESESWKGCKVDVCFWMGSHYEECDLGCDYSNGYCHSLWVVLSYNAGPGDQPPSPGCWYIQLLCEEADPPPSCGATAVNLCQ
jgi:hypothetical protein